MSKSATGRIRRGEPGASPQDYGKSENTSAESAIHFGLHSNPPAVESRFQRSFSWGPTPEAIPQARLR